MIEMDELVKRLTKRQPIEADGGVKGTVDGFKESIDLGYVHIKFTETKGGTNLGVRLVKELCDYSKADFAAKKGIVKVGGELTLNYEKVRCLAEVNLATLHGEGWLEYIEPSEPWRLEKWKQAQH
jgi:hypothetical protein